MSGSEAYDAVLLMLMLSGGQHTLAEGAARNGRKPPASILGDPFGAPFLKPDVYVWLNGRARRFFRKVLRFLVDGKLLQPFYHFLLRVEVLVGIVRQRIAVLFKKAKCLNLQSFKLGGRKTRLAARVVLPLRDAASIGTLSSGIWPEALKRRPGRQV